MRRDSAAYASGPPDYVDSGASTFLRRTVIAPDDSCSLNVSPFVIEVTRPTRPGFSLATAAGANDALAAITASA